MAENGFSLVEVLVSLFVLAVGVTGVVAMQLTALRTTQQTELRTRALYLASEMADSVRGNVLQTLYQNESNSYLQLDDDRTSPTSSVLTDNCYQPDSPCDENQLAQFYIDDWLLRLHAALPDGRARICRDSALRDEKTDQISWSCNEVSSTAPLVIKIAWQKRNAGKEGSDETDHALSVIGLIVTPHTK